MEVNVREILILLEIIDSDLNKLIDTSRILYPDRQYYYDIKNSLNIEINKLEKKKQQLLALELGIDEPKINPVSIVSKPLEPDKSSFGTFAVDFKQEKTQIIEKSNITELIEEKQIIKKRAYRY